MNRPLTRRDWLLLSSFVLICIFCGIFYAFLTNGAVDKKSADDATRIEEKLKDIEAHAATLPSFPTADKTPPERRPLAPAPTPPPPLTPPPPPGAPIANTKDPALYQSQRYAMKSFAIPLLNGNYTLNLYFAETYEGITGPGQRVFDFAVNGTDFKNFDIYQKAGGPNSTYIQSIPLNITAQELKITFTPHIENPCISAIEIIPQ